MLRSDRPDSSTYTDLWVLVDSKVITTQLCTLAAMKVNHMFCALAI